MLPSLTFGDSLLTASTNNSRGSQGVLISHLSQCQNGCTPVALIQSRRLAWNSLHQHLFKSLIVVTFVPCANLSMANTCHRFNVFVLTDYEKLVKKRDRA